LANAIADRGVLEEPWPAPRVAWYAVALLSLAYVLSYLDRIVINLLVVPIQADLGINDTQFGMLQSLAFGIFYTVMALPLGRLADARDRRFIVAGGIALFSLFTALSGLARTYAQLFCARIGVGVGEASLTPSAYSMLSDLFPPERLGRAIGTFTMSAFIGTGLAYIGGGAVIDWLTTVGDVAVPGLGTFAPWQMAFILVGLPGLLVAPLMLTVREPLRRGGSQAGSVPLQTVLAEVARRRSTLGWLFAGFSMVTLSGYASAVWTPAFFIRAYGWEPGQIGLWYGLIYLTFGTSGALFGGWLCDRLTARGVLDAPVRVAAFGYLGTGLFGGLAPLMPTPELALVLFVPATFLATLPFPLAGTSIQLITPNRLRGQVSALYMLVINVVGLGLGPLIVGAFTDYVFTEPADVRYSLALVNAVAAPLALMLLMAAFAGYRRLRLEVAEGAPGRARS
jgi:MFS family permease